jgi:type I restriction enzyme, R subunit
VISTHFASLAKGHDPLFLQLAEAAERALAFDPNTTLLKLRQFAEAFARHTAAADGVLTGPQLSQADLLRHFNPLEAGLGFNQEPGSRVR